MLRFQLDEHVSPAIASGLRLRGIDCTTTNGAGLRTADDPTQLAYCLREGRVMVSSDDDMLILSASGTDHAGIAWCKMQRRTIGEIVNALVFLNANRSPEDMKNWVEYI